MVEPISQTCRMYTTILCVCLILYIFYPYLTDTKSLKEENKQLKQMQVCKICMDKYVSITFLPCGHLVCCEDCAKNMRKCPICRKRIKGQVRTFMS